ncbi:LuxR family transcriptional regulator [Micromonospora endophytica]|uniref:LuxR family transcriptional regulator n=1 Tax=Micromonospora endophytica TaxID=515350 RepID=A0A2W2D5W0_9ACTN|nr:LuxR family transcriptional regulator [Micromonospora endophytica]RIW46280.1 helix-turn-helix transcriptional regulator [Micromonospora endophytica]
MGRRAERAAIEHLLAQAQAGRSGAVVMRGEAGIGKTAILDHTRDVAAASGFRVENSVGVKPERQFAFAGLHQLCAPLLAHADALPEPQQAALLVAFGLRGGAAPDRFLVGLATLNLLAEVAENGPLLCLVDDAQWLDEASAQVLAFVARRVAAERMALMFALRDADASDVRPFAGLPELRLDGLGESDARELLASAVRAPLDVGVRDRIIAEARGNPLALLELPRSAPPTHLAGGFELPDTLSVPHRIEDEFRRRSSNLPPDTQLLLLVAAAEPTGDVALLWHATAQLGIDPHAADAAETASLLTTDTRVRFRHPLVRSAVYRTATPPDRRRVHGALAAATDPQTDPDRRAWHRAQSVLGTDEDAAAELEQSADRARARGGLAAAAAFLQQAAELTPQPTVRASRALKAAHAKHEAGAPDDSLTLLAEAAAGPLDALQRAHLELLRARITFHTTRGSDAPKMLLDAAKKLTPLDPPLARETYLHALQASFHAGRLGHGRWLQEAAEAARAAPAPPTPPRPIDLLLDGLAIRFTQGFEASVPTLQQALESLCNHDSPADDDNRSWLWLACHIAAMLWDDEAIYVLASRGVRLARETGALATLPAALNALTSVLVLTGETARATELVAEEQAITQATGAPPLPNARLTLASWRGRRPETSELYEAMVREARGRGEGATIGLAQISLAVLHNGLGNYDDALAAATPPVEYDELTFSSIALPELIEAAVRSGQPERAATAMELLESRARASGTPWALGLKARSRALISTGPAAEEQYREAIERLGQCRVATHLARAHLVYGEWLRREGRRRDAREQLRTAYELLSDMGADAFAERAARELRATGEHPRKRTAQPADALTAHELHIARLVANGATSREVGTQLFLSPRTIEAHLRNIFGKLGITSRRQLKEARLP